MVDLSQLKADAILKKAQAKDKIAAARAEVVTRKALLKNPPPQYVAMPKMTGDAQADSAADLDAVQEGFRKRAKDEGNRFALATDTEYWACLCFQTREQKDAFLKALDLLKFGDKYLDGQKVAAQLGVELPAADVPYNTSSKTDPAWAGLI